MKKQDSINDHEKQLELIQSSKMAALGTLVAGIAHEINNPNHSIMINMSYLDKVYKDMLNLIEERFENLDEFSFGGLPFYKSRERTHLILEDIKEDTKRIKRIVDDLKLFSRPNPIHEKSPVQLNDVLKAALSLMGNFIKKTTDHFSVVYAPDLPLVSGQFQGLEQVIVNIVQNACQALPNREKGCEIKTYHDQENDQIVLKLVDEGLGIPQELIKNIKDPFFTTKRDSGGMGLGLSVSNSIVLEHEGSLDFISKVNTGTTTYLRLPVLKGEG